MQAKIINFEMLYGMKTQFFNIFITSIGKSGFFFHIYILKVILEIVYVTVQLENSVSLLWLDQAIQWQLFFILATVPFNPLNCIFLWKIFSGTSKKWKPPIIFTMLSFFYPNCLRKLTKDVMVIVTENVAQYLVVFHIEQKV